MKETLLYKVTDNGKSRRQFLKLTGTLAGLSLFATSCSKDEDKEDMAPDEQPDLNEPGINADGSVRLGTGDIGILNYAYALEQLESAFYEKVAADFYPGINNTEREAFRRLRDIETGHRDFYKKALGNKAIPQLEVDFSTINFEDRVTVLMAARNFEDVGLSAYNGSGRLLTDPSNLAVAGKIASVEGRNGSYLRWLMGEAFFAPSMDNPVIVDSNGLDLSRRPSEVLALADKFIVTKIDASRLPSY
jgi:hypothetical protein